MVPLPCDKGLRLQHWNVLRQSKSAKTAIAVRHRSVLPVSVRQTALATAALTTHNAYDAVEVFIQSVVLALGVRSRTRLFSLFSMGTRDDSTHTRPSQARADNRRNSIQYFSYRSPLFERGIAPLEKKYRRL